MKRYTDLRCLPYGGELVPAVEFDDLVVFRPIDHVTTYVKGRAIDRLHEYEKTHIPPENVLYLKDEIKRLERELKESKDKYDGLQKKRETLAETNSKLNGRNGELERKVACLRAERIELESEISKLKIERDPVGIVKENEMLKKLHEHDLKNIDDLIVEREQLNDEYKRLENENNKLKNELEDCERLLNNFHYSSYQKQYEETKNQLDDVFKTLDDKIIDNAKLKEENENLKKRIDDLMSEEPSEFINNCIYEAIRRGDTSVRLYFEKHHVSLTFKPLSDKE